MEAQDIERAAKSHGHTLRTSTLTKGPERKSSTTECEEVGNNDFDSEDDADLLKCAESDNGMESLLENIGKNAKSVFMSSNMISYIINFPLADKLAKLNLSVKKIFSSEGEDPPRINLGDWMFSNPWLQEERQECKRGVLVSAEMNPAMCMCEFCVAANSPVNLRPGSRGKIRAVQQVARESGIGTSDPEILGYGAPTPLVTLKIMSGCQGSGARVATLRVTPDTGATVDIIRYDIAKVIGAEIKPNSSGYKLSDAQNADIKIVGTCKLRLQIPGGKWRSVVAIVTQKLSDSLLLSWNTQKFLGILPMGWPHELYAR